MNAANEEAVQAFIDQRICLTDIPRVIEAVMNRHITKPVSDLDTVLSADSSARTVASAEIERLSKPAEILAERSV
jgi:1-deoxy-D-xylulose-5-phosphate reductoisomerase